MATKLTRKKTIIAVVVLLLVAGAAAAAYFLYLAPLLNKTDAVAPDVKTGTTYKVSLQKKEDTVTKLVAAGDEESIKQAGTIVDKEVKTANDSGNDAYILDANLAKATFLINTGQAQEAIDTVLLPLLKQYESNKDYKLRIFGFLRWAYGEVGDKAKATEYGSQLPVNGGN